MSLSIRPLHRHFVAEVTGVDLHQPLDAATAATLRDAFVRHAVLVFPAQNLDDDSQVAFTRQFGPLERTLTTALGSRQDVSNLSNVDAAGRRFATDDARSLFLLGNQRWHTDSSFKPVPANGSALSARVVPPEGGETEYADARAAYDALDDAMKERLEGLEAEHSYVYSQGQISLAAMTAEEIAKVPPVRHPLVRVHPDTGRPALYIGRHASHIIGWPVAEGRALLAELLAHATQPRFVYCHRWQVGELVMWDNRSVLHRGRPWDAERYDRVMHRTTLAGDAVVNPWVIGETAAG